MRYSLTQDTRKLINNAFLVLEDFYKPGIEYKNAGIKLTRLVDDDGAQMSFFNGMDQDKSNELMAVIDKINQINGPNMVRSLACGASEGGHKARQDKLSPGYLTRWSDIPRCK